MRFNLYATFRVLAGAKNGEVDLPDGATVAAAVQAIVAAYPILRPHWLDAAGELYAHVHIFVNGCDVQTLPDGMHTRLEPAAVLDFFPPVAGGD